MDKGTGLGAIRQRLCLQDDVTAHPDHRPLWHFAVEVSNLLITALTSILFCLKVLKRIEEFAGKMQRRAEGITTQLHGLEDHARTAESELKGALATFRELSEYRMVEHRVAEDEGPSSRLLESTKDSAATGVRAQSYEEDILPRYREALSLGLASCREYMDRCHRSNRRCRGGFAFKPGLAHGPLPHIIGSEEYIHDNSCGLTDEHPFDSSMDFLELIEPRGFYSASEHLNFNEPVHENLFGSQEGPSRKEGVEILESAALEFKAMLEAALLNPYKFYDEQETTIDSKVISHSDESHPNQTPSEAYDAACNSSTQNLHISPDSGLVSTEGTKSPVQNLPHEISVLLSGSLFDAEEELGSSVEKPFATPSAVLQGLNSEKQDHEVPACTQNLPDYSNFGSEKIDTLEQAEALSSLGIADEDDQSGQNKIPHDI